MQLFLNAFLELEVEPLRKINYEKPIIPTIELSPIYQRLIEKNIIQIDSRTDLPIINIIDNRVKDEILRPVTISELEEKITSIRSLTEAPVLTVLSLGCGQDSVTIANMIFLSKVFREYITNGSKFIIIMSDTGNEKPETYRYLMYFIKECEKYHIEFYFLQPNMNFNNRKINTFMPTWESLKKRYETSLGMQTKTMKNRSCTTNLKIESIYKFLEIYLSDIYNLTAGRKTTIKVVGKKFGKIRVILGISDEERKRIKEPEEDLGNSFWKYIEKNYILIDLNMRRIECVLFLQNNNIPVPVPSNCLMCHYQTASELVLFKLLYYQDYVEYVMNEKEKVAFRQLYRDKGNKTTVFGKIDSIKVTNFEKDKELITVYFEDKEVKMRYLEEVEELAELSMLTQYSKLYPELSGEDLELNFIWSLYKLNFMHGHNVCSVY